MIDELCNICLESRTDVGPPFFCDECQKLVDVCVEALRIARQVGVPKYGPSSWRDVPVQEHINHASKHLHPGRKFYTDTDVDVEDHLAHAICRLVMARVLTDAR